MPTSLLRCFTSANAVAQKQRSPAVPASELQPINSAELHTWIKDRLQINIPQESICPGHDAPFVFVAESFFEETQNCIVIAPRNGGKTMSAAALEFAEAVWKKGCEVCHLGAVLLQAKRAYKYIRSWATRHQIDYEINKVTIGETVFESGSTIEIIPGTMNGVNSPHPQKAVIDEFELLPWAIYEEASSMPKSANGVSAAIRSLTTRKRANGNAQAMLDGEAAKRGFKIYTWCIFEVMTRCDCEIDCKSGKYCKYSEYRTFDSFGKQITWPEVCRGKARRCNGYYSFHDVLAKFIGLSWETFNAQWLCNRPERFDCVFPEFDYGRNTIDSWDLRADWQFARGWDFGLDDPTAIGFYQYQLDTRQLVQFDEYVISGRLIGDIARDVREKCDKLCRPDEWEDWGDPSGIARSAVDGRSYISVLGEEEIHVKTKRKSISSGIQAMKKMLLPATESGEAPFRLVRERCAKTISSFEMAGWDRQEGKAPHSNEKYLHDEHSHQLDQARYLIQGIFPLVPGEVRFG